MILPVTVPMVFISPFSGRLIGRFGARRLMTVGMVFGVAGLLVLTQVGATTPYGLILVGYLLFGIALGLVYAPMSTAAMAAMPGEKVGIASGVLAMDRVLAGAVALAATGRRLPRPARRRPLLRRRRRRLDLGRRRPLALGVGLTWAFVRDVEPAGPEPAVAGEPADGRAPAITGTTAVSISSDRRRVWKRPIHQSGSQTVPRCLTKR